MNANELMLGDWVYQREIKNLTPTQIEYGWMIEECEEMGFEPIPITPEILEKSGFKIDKNETCCKRYFFACNLGKVPQTVVEFSFYGEGVSADTLFKCWTKPESCDGENSIHICDLKSVHQLQHALRLGGIKKEIEL